MVYRINKKAQFVAILSLFFILGLIAINYYLVQGTGTVTKMYFTPSYVLDNDLDIKEYSFDLNQKVKYTSFKAFVDLAENGGFHGKKCETWSGKCNPTINLKENFKKYFIDYFLESNDFDISVKIKNNNFVISGKYKNNKKIFESFNVRTEVPIDFSYVLDYDVSLFEKLFNNCMVLSCDELSEGCMVSKNKCSSDINYIKMEYEYKKDNGFIKPKILFKLSKAKELEV